MLKRFCCWIGWHWKPVATGHDGCSQHGVCSHCGARGMWDSQGNFFAATDR